MIARNKPLLLARLITIACVLVMALPVGRLLSHKSQSADVLNRYSIPYTGFLLAYLAMFALLAILAFLPTRRWEQLQSWLTKIFSSKTMRILWWLILIGSIVFLILFLDIVKRWSPGRSLIFQLALVTLCVWANIIVVILSGSDRIRTNFAFLVVVSVTILILMAGVEIFLRKVPMVIPAPVILSLPGGGRYLHQSDFVVDEQIRVGYRYAPMQDRWSHYDPYDPKLMGSLGIIGPYGRQDIQTTQLHFVTDENGFLNTPPVNGSTYDIVVAGDSFLGLTADEHWLNIMGQLTNSEVLNLSNSGWGTQSEVEAIRLYGLDKNPEWIILAYFEGNDLWDVIRYEEKKSSGLNWIEHDVKTAGSWQSLIVPQLLKFGFEEIRFGLGSRDYDYPIDVEIGSNKLRLAFSHAYVGNLTARADDIERSDNFMLASEKILEAKELSESIGASFLFVYIPTEPHVYLPHITDLQHLEKMVRSALRISLNQDKSLGRTPGQISPEMLKRFADDQAKVFESFADQHEIEFLDLTPYLQAEAGKGVELYNYADTHWNSVGHTFAAKVVANYILGVE